MSKNFFLGVLIGAVSGAILGILFAPKAGKETRHDIVNFATEIKNKIGEKISRLEKITKEKYKAVVDETIGAYSRQQKITVEEAEDLRNDLMAKFDKIKDIIES